jgi:hypothetical protein
MHTQKKKKYISLDQHFGAPTAELSPPREEKVCRLA